MTILEGQKWNIHITTNMKGLGSQLFKSLDAMHFTIDIAVLCVKISLSHIK